MTDIDLNNMSLNELKKLQKDVTKAIDGYQDRQRKDALAAAQAAAKELGYTLADLTGLSSKKTKTKTITAPKYRHPENSEMTWTGRGRQPEWMKSALDNGQSKDEFLIVQDS
ncbi:H-NS family nucleoid-associated regulatory protein [Loktanella salsilacus]|jgi:DNA-binding protein H-NS|uniref:H-NS histone family protein n=1 Tax=Loktanella salsilacus TaxID=195913 RepID=UPI003703B922